MLPEIGFFSLVLAFVFSGLLALAPLMHWTRAVTPYAVGQFIFVALAYALLTICFLTDDFTVNYVLNHSSLSLPWFYKACAVWGGHEGSMLLWVFILSLWMLAVCYFSQTLDKAMKARVLSVLGLISFGFFLFLLIASNPFARQFDVLNASGRDLSPLLQDLGFLFHPPMLYMGYVGFSVAFAFAIATLIAGRLETSWSQWTRPWTLAAWCCLTLGITLGSWWAYRELGWGGFWFWDPVENASFMPWLVGTALVHALMVSEKHDAYHGWTLLLAITAFSLSLIGTFLVRSGVLTSVHAFAVDPMRGLFILCFLFITIGGSLLLFAFRANTVSNQQKPESCSKENALLLGNVFLAVLMCTVLLGTLYPLIIDSLGLGKLSVGAPYFNRVFVPLMCPVLFLMGAAIHLKWRTDSVFSLLKRIRLIGSVSLILPVSLCLIFNQPLQPGVLIGLTLAFWVLLSTAKAIFLRFKQVRWQTFTPGFSGMILAHTGIALTVVGITISTGFGLHDDIKMSPKTQIALAGEQLEFIGVHPLVGPNYHGMRAEFQLHHKKRTHTIYPEKRIYDITQMPMTDSAIDATLFRDIYLALGDPLGDEAWAVRVYYKPFIRWIWGGGFLIFLGGFVALLPRKSVRRTS